MNPRPSIVDSTQQYCLRWKYHHSNLQLMFSQLLERESFCDVTLACEGKHIRAHKVMLSACSTYFDSILSQHDENNPIVVFKDVRFEDLKALVHFMYKGEIKIENTQLTPLLKTAEELRIKGLAPSTHRCERTPDQFSQRLERYDEEEEMCETPAKRARMSEQMSWHRPMSVPISPAPPSNSNRVSNTNKESKKDDIELEEHKSEPARVNNVTREGRDNGVDRVVGRDGGQMEDSDGETDELEEEEELPLPIAPETVYESEEEEGGEWRKRDVNGNEAEEFDMPAMPCHLTNSAFSSLLENQEEDESRTNTNTEEKSIDYAKYSWVLKMNQFLDKGGRRPQFWEENSTRRVMEAIKNKELEMKQGAEIMGVSYGTLYGRYRDAYGCLKHPYRVKEFWSDQGPNEILTKLRRKELTLFRAAELLNVTQTTLANYLATLRHPSPELPDAEDYETPPSLFARPADEHDDIEGAKHGIEGARDGFEGAKDGIVEKKNGIRDDDIDERGLSRRQCGKEKKDVGKGTGVRDKEKCMGKVDQDETKVDCVE